jgi:hypothetical protein
MTMYENNREVRPTGAEAEELVDAPPPSATRRPRTGEDDPDEDATNLPGDDRAPQSARPLRDG